MTTHEFPADGMELAHILVVADAARARGGPTADKPEVIFAPPGAPGTVSHAMTIRMADCQAAYETLRGRGAQFLTADGVRVGNALLLP